VRPVAEYDCAVGPADAGYCCSAELQKSGGKSNSREHLKSGTSLGCICLPKVAGSLINFEKSADP